jgi:hypothetical protein
MQEPFEDIYADEINEFSEQLDGCRKPFVYFILFIIISIVMIVYLLT